MPNTPVSLLDEIETFLSKTGMGKSYLGKRAVGNSEVVDRLRRKGRVWPETEEKLRQFMRNHPRQSKQSGPRKDRLNEGAA